MIKNKYCANKQYAIKTSVQFCAKKVIMFAFPY